MSFGEQMLDSIAKKIDKEKYKKLSWTGSFTEYLDIVQQNPAVLRTSFQRTYDMVMSYGFKEYVDNKKKIVHYNFFDDPFDDGKDAVFGLDIPLMKLVNLFRSAAQGLGTEKRVLLLHGPVGSSKSTVVRMLKKGLEAYSQTEEGQLFTFDWIVEGENGEREFVPSPMHEEPLLLIPPEIRKEFLAKINEEHQGERPYRYQVQGDLCPVSRFYYNEFMKQYEGDWSKVLKEHVQVRRLVMSEQDRVGIGTFQPKDEKNQDSTELTGDINYRKIAIYGSDSDPRAFNFDGEFNVANRGLIEFVEVLKLDVAFLYDLLGASQEHKIKPKKFSQTDIDEVIIGHTNEPEYKKLQSNEYMEALRDRTVKVDIPYITRYSEEKKIYEKDFGVRQADIHIAPHTFEIAAMWAVLTRLEDSTGNINIMQKLKLYDGKALPDFTEDTVVELRKAAQREGLQGISPRYVQDKISNTLVRYADEGHISPFMVMNQLEAGLRHHSLITNEKDRERYREMLGLVRQEYEEIIKNEVQRAITADEDAISKLCANYVDNVKAYTQKEKVKNIYTGAYEEPDEQLMRSIEEKIDIPDSRKDDFRREIMNYIGALALEGKRFDYRSNERLDRALERKLFEDRKDSIKLTTLVSDVVDKETQEKIDIVKQRLIKNYGYNEQSATDVLNYVASIFARGDTK